MRLYKQVDRLAIEKGRHNQPGASRISLEDPIGVLEIVLPRCDLEPKTRFAANPLRGSGQKKYSRYGKLEPRVYGHAHSQGRDITCDSAGTAAANRRSADRTLQTLLCALPSVRSGLYGPRRLYASSEDLLADVRESAR